jgi:dipeptidyl aminopeptidase/acylaminoacyl peptidase
MRSLINVLIPIFLLTCAAYGQKQRLIVNMELLSAPINPKVKPNYKDSINVYGITYLSEGLKVKGFIAAPKQKGNYPVIIYNRGGNGDFGKLGFSYVNHVLGKIAKEGYIVVASQYRGNDGGEGEEQFGGDDVNDVTNLIDILPEILNTDTTRIGMYGWSRGGMMTYLAHAKTNRLKAIAVGGAVSDLTKSITRPDMEQVFKNRIPGYLQNKDAELNKRSVIKWVNKLPKNVPVLLLHGSADWRVDVSQTYNLAQEFQKEGIPYRLMIFEGADHGITEFRDEVYRQVVNWFDRFLKNNEPLPDMKPHGQ